MRFRSQTPAGWSPLTILVVGMLLLWALASSGCVDEPAPCPPGSLACPCADTFACDDGLFCAGDGTCIAPECALGGEGCACRIDGGCDLDSAGRRMVCAEGACVPTTCVPGTPDCGCRNGACDGDALCVAEDEGMVCRVPGCGPGEEGCGCLPDRTCGTDAGGLALVCDAGRCVAPDCVPGTAGCLCRADFGCDAGLACGELNRCGPPSCARGALGCACERDGTCRGEDAVCVAGRCEVNECPTGQQGCACDRSFRCDAAGPGGALLCEAGRCAPIACVQGDASCGCRSDGRCNDEDLICQRGLCTPIRCRPGEADCTCRDDASCDAGLTCRNGLTCVDATGFAGGACLPNSSCFRGNRCDAGVCQPCSTGGLGCTCFENDTCRTGLACRGGTCVDENDLLASIPAPPLCYTPCRSLPGDDATCGADGLAPGCPDDQRCLDGSCVRPGEQPPTCRIASDCPEWQSCVSGRCYSTCEGDGDCPTGRSCWRRVCRLPCASDLPCPGGTTCSLIDGRDGYCLPGAGAPDPEREVPSVIVSTEAVVFTQDTRVARIEVTNPDEVPVRVRVQKVEHAVAGGDGGVATVRSREGDATCVDTGGCPLVWLRIGASVGAPRSQRHEFELGPGETVAVFLSDAETSGFSRWDGVIEIGALGGARTTVELSWSEAPVGYWSGKLVYFGVFPDEQLDAWVRGLVPATEVPNALINVWANFRAGRVPYVEFRAALRAMRTQSWSFPLVLDRCRAATGEGNARCFPYDNADGVGVLTSNVLSQAVPRGESEITFAAWLDEGAGRCGSGTAYCLGGAVDSDDVPHYPAHPRLSVGLATSPDACTQSGPDGCLTRLSMLEADVTLGGRRPPQGTVCPSGFVSALRPELTWPFLQDAGVRVVGGLAERAECRDATLPRPGAEARNASLAGATPFRDGRTFERRLRLVDGYLIGQDTLLAIVKEEQTSIVPGRAPAPMYGLLTLTRRTPLTVAVEEAPEPTDQQDTRPTATPWSGVTCSTALQSRLRAPAPVGSAAWVRHMARGVLDGVASDATPPSLRSSHEVHYLCAETGLLDGGPGNVTRPGPARVCSDACPTANNGICEDGGPGASSTTCTLATDCSDCGLRFEGDTDARLACPEGSPVTFFALRSSGISQAEIAAHPCQLDGSCATTLANWVAQGRYGILMNIPWRCDEIRFPGGSTEARDRCDDDRRDLRWGRQFLDPDNGTQVMPSLASAIDDAFRYRFAFPTRSGALLGFAPQPCTGGVSRDEYCFDAPAIHSVGERLDCALALYRDHASSLTGDQRQRLEETLRESFAGREVDRRGLPPIVVPGFERMASELMLLLGDDSFARAQGSRFDLLGEESETFDARAFEGEGPLIAGVTGTELVALYRAVQFYELALARHMDRAAALIIDAESAPRPLLTAESLELWVSRVLLASTQRARAQARIARRWHELGRGELARAVFERAFVGAHLDGSALIEVVRAVQASAPGTTRDQADRFVEDTMRRMRVALHELLDLRSLLEDDLNPWGFTEDHVPFPATVEGGESPVEIQLRRAWERITLALAVEVRAIDERTNLPVSEAEFRSELQSLRNESDTRLGQICGTFVATTDGVRRTLPAIRRYASLSPALASLGDPCGLVGNGALFDAALDLDAATEVLRQGLARLDGISERIDAQVELIERQCQIVLDVADVVFEAESQASTLLAKSAQTKLIMSTIKQTISSLLEVKGLLQCEVGLSTDCPMAAAALGIYAVGAVISIAGTTAMQAVINAKENEIREIERNVARSEIASQCDSFRLQGAFDLQQVVLERANAELELLRAQQLVTLTAQRIDGLFNEVRRLEAEESEARQLLVDSASAASDPNLRIYRNSSIRLADETFRSAQRALFQAVRVFEYTTGQTWAGREDLYLTRMVRASTPSLEDVYFELEDAWIAWTEANGSPELRLAILSLRDDIFRVPFTDDRARPVAWRERVAAFRERLLDPEWRDGAGRIVIPFPTLLTQTSPLTVGHRIAWIEVELVGTDVGDPTGRVYLAQRGASALRVQGNTVRYYAFPERTAVIDVFFNGARFFDDVVYRSRRFADRPFVNSRWELVLDPAAEEVNRDIRMGSLTDARLYVYYTDLNDPSAF